MHQGKGEDTWTNCNKVSEEIGDRTPSHLWDFFRNNLRTGKLLKWPYIGSCLIIIRIILSYLGSMQKVWLPGILPPAYSSQFKVKFHFTSFIYHACKEFEIEMIVSLVIHVFRSHLLLKSFGVTRPNLISPTFCSLNSLDLNGLLIYISANAISIRTISST